MSRVDVFPACTNLLPLLLTHSVNYKTSIRVEGVLSRRDYLLFTSYFFSLCWAEKALRIGVSSLCLKAKGLDIHPTVFRQWIWELGMVKWSNERWKTPYMGLGNGRLGMTMTQARLAAESVEGRGIATWEEV